MIHISGFENSNLIAFSLQKRVNAHSVCSFTVKAGNVDHSDFLQKIGKDISIDNGDEFIFFGYIDDVNAEVRFSETEVTIHAVSYSKKLDVAEKRRIFQNPEKTLQTITRYIQSESSSEIECSCQETIQEPIIQHNETDFAFLIRLAQRCGMQIFVRDMIKANHISLLIERTINTSVQKLSEEPEKISFQIRCQSDISQKYQMIDMIVRDQFFDTGVRLCIDGTTYYVAELSLELERGVFKYHYVLLEEGAVPDTVSMTLPAYVMMRGITSDHDDPEGKGRIQVKFDCEYVDAQPDRMMWIPYLTPYTAENGGIVFLPDKGDIVDIIYASGTLTAQQSTGNTRLAGSLMDVQNKHIANINGKRITFSKDCLELTAGNNTILLTENDIVIKVKDTKLSVSDKGIHIKSTGSAISVERDISIHAGNNVDVKGMKIYLK